MSKYEECARCGHMVDTESPTVPDHTCEPECCAELRDRLREVEAERDEARAANRGCLAASAKDAWRAEAAERRVAELEAECASISEEFGLPPTMRPAEGEIRRVRKLAEEFGDELAALRAVAEAARHLVNPSDGVRKTVAAERAWGDLRMALAALDGRGGGT